MGVLGHGAFANDDALDWLARLDPAEGLEPLRPLLHAAVDAPDPALDLRQALVLLAAVELIAAAAAALPEDPTLPDPARRFLAAQPDTPDEGLRILATRALDLIGTASALAELWSVAAPAPSPSLSGSASASEAEAAETEKWHTRLDALRMRLASPGPPLAPRD